MLHALTDSGTDSGTGSGTGFGVLDGLRRPKPGWKALVDACRPVIVTADPLPAWVRGGDHLELAVHVVNDTRADVGDLRVHARVIGPDGVTVSEQDWEGNAGADDCVLVGHIDADIPVGIAPGELAVELMLTGDPHHGPAVAVSNRYTTAII